MRNRDVPTNRRGDGVLFLHAILDATAEEPYRLASTSSKEREEFAEFCAVIAKSIDLVTSLGELRLGDSPKRVAIGMGFDGSREHYAFLQTHGLPPYKILHGWLMVFILVHEFSNDKALCDWALHSGEWVSSHYRMVKGVTRRNWRDVKGLGVKWVVARAMIAWRQHLDEAR